MPFVVSRPKYRLYYLATAIIRRTNSRSKFPDFTATVLPSPLGLATLLDARRPLDNAAERPLAEILGRTPSSGSTVPFPEMSVAGYCLAPSSYTVAMLTIQHMRMIFPSTQTGR